MKRSYSSDNNKKFRNFIHSLKEDQILSTRSMSFVRGGTDEGEGTGGVPVVILPPKPPQ